MIIFLTAFVVHKKSVPILDCVISGKLENTTVSLSEHLEQQTLLLLCNKVMQQSNPFMMMIDGLKDEFIS